LIKILEEKMQKYCVAIEEIRRTQMDVETNTPEEAIEIAKSDLDIFLKGVYATRFEYTAYDEDGAELVIECGTERMITVI
jgi:hypothetical protein